MDEEDSVACPNGGMRKSDDEEKKWSQKHHAQKMPW